MAEKIETGKDAKAATPDKGASAAVEAKVSAETKDTKSKVDAVVKPEETPKPAEKKPDDKKAEPKPESSEASNVRRIDSKQDAPMDTKNKPFKYARNTVIGSLGAMTALGPSVISQIPLIGKIPYLAEASGWLQSGLTSLTSPLGLGTGVNATNSVLASFSTALGPVGAAAIGIPSALWLTGMARNLIRGDNTPKGFWGNVADATELIGQLPFMPYHFAMKARVKTGKVVDSAWKNIKKPFSGAWNLAGKIAKSAWNTTSATTSAALTPTKWGIGGALLGVAMTGGTAAAIPVTAGLGYGIMNYLKNTGALDPKEGGSHSAKHGH